ncbi:MAG: hypothetical protein H6627_09160 [Calditrichae bacterium]|nr:hypothetical protein [Calditrichota bacterium]MCB9058723.1 hypothetical protein [Calditrichia bacterium]
MSTKQKAVLISIFVYYILAFSAEFIHNKIDPTGLQQQISGSLIIAGIYNTLFIILAGFIAASIYKKDHRHIATYIGLIIIIINFITFFVFPDEASLTFRMLKVVIPLYASITGGALYKKFQGIN